MFKKIGVTNVLVLILMIPICGLALQVKDQAKKIEFLEGNESMHSKEIEIYEKGLAKVRDEVWAFSRQEKTPTFGSTFELAEKVDGIVGDAQEGANVVSKQRFLELFPELKGMGGISE